MLGGILAGLEVLDRCDDAALAAAEPDLLARQIGTLFAQFERLVHSTREFYTYLTQVLSRFDLDRGEFQAFKSALLDYLQRFVDEISRYMPQIADLLGRLAARVPVLCVTSKLRSTPPGHGRTGRAPGSGALAAGLAGAARVGGSWSPGWTARSARPLQGCWAGFSPLTPVGSIPRR